MEKEELIIKLIQQDFKHLQLLLGIQKLGFDNDSNHFLGILDIVISLLGIEEKENVLIDEIYQTYYEDGLKVLMIPITYEGEELYPLAKDSFMKLKALYERHLKSVSNAS
ncbi:hypothetical protein Belba_3647 [Belliella baltica DSM 15883]|uniref:Uncharacterized protein n=1 Tax=Belliella baltica (strain DSM 15883 / CIP 108006 / LMG 21964 / BA134) TaxID=866536 RepID=I3ZA71_BELBD|nr:hypothetical protein [Belliella baltica]AFL86139.1 hypothetical protein Belba_3647 [Belliella baltica DSM 15883]